MSLSHSRRRSARTFLRELRANALAIGLVLGTLALVIGSYATANRTIRLYSEFSTRALTEFASMGGFYFRSRAFTTLDRIGASFAYMDGLHNPAAGPDLKGIRSDVDSIIRCKCGAHVLAHGYATGFFGDSNSVIYRSARPRTGNSAQAAGSATASARADDTTNARVLSEKLAALRAIAARKKGLKWVTTIRVGSDSAQPWILLIAAVPTPPGAPDGFMAVDMNVDDWSSRPLSNIHAAGATILSASMTEGMTNAEIAEFRLYSPKHGTVFHRPTRNPSGIVAHREFDLDSLLMLSVELSRAATERIVQGARPQSNAFMQLLLPLVAVSLLVAIALTMIRAERLARARTRFAASVSHELRTPLTHILLNAETLHYGRERDANDREATAGVIAREARRLVYLVENVLQFSKAEHDVPRLRLRPVRVDLVVSELADQWYALVEATGASLEVNAVHAVWANADSNALRLVLTNLVDNAIHHAPFSKIQIESRQDRDWATVIVDDDGPGIPEAEREVLLQPFKRAERSQVEHPTGTGIGLAVVVQLVRAMNGELELGNAPSNGLRVTIRLRPAEGGAAQVAT